MSFNSKRTFTGGIAGNRRRAFFGVKVIRVHREIDAVDGRRRKRSLQLVNESVRLFGIQVGRGFGSGRLCYNANIELCLVGNYGDRRLTVNTDRRKRRRWRWLLCVYPRRTRQHNGSKLQKPALPELAEPECRIRALSPHVGNISQNEAAKSAEIGLN